MALSPSTRAQEASAGRPPVDVRFHPSPLSGNGCVIYPSSPSGIWLVSALFTLTPDGATPGQRQCVVEFYSGAQLVFFVLVGTSSDMATNFTACIGGATDGYWAEAPDASGSRGGGPFLVLPGWYIKLTARNLQAADTITNCITMSTPV